MKKTNAATTTKKARYTVDESRRHNGHGEIIVTFGKEVFTVYRKSDARRIVEALEANNADEARAIADSRETKAAKSKHGTTTKAATRMAKATAAKAKAETKLAAAIEAKKKAEEARAALEAARAEKKAAREAKRAEVEAAKKAREAKKAAKLAEAFAAMSEEARAAIFAEFMKK